MNESFDKKEYIASRFKKMAHKKYELYCVSRIIHRLNRTDVEFTTQQLFIREDGHRALADLYFPQLNWSIEIDENYHLKSKKADEERTIDIEKNDKLIREKLRALEEIVDTPINQIRIDASDAMKIEDINTQCDEVVSKIETQIEALGATFVPWTSPYSDPEYGKNNKILRIEDNIRYRTIRDAGFAIFNRSFPSAGACFPLEKEKLIYAWFPWLQLEGEQVEKKYRNTYSADGTYIYESSEEGNNIFVENELEKADEIRYAFPGYKDHLRKKMYKFKGVYKRDVNLSKKENKVVWKRVATEIDLTDFFEKTYENSEALLLK